MSKTLINPFIFATCALQPSSDPHWASVSALLHMNGSDGSTTFTDETGKVWTANGDAQIDTAQSKFGGASGLFDGDGDWLEHANTDFLFGSGDFTVECWVRMSSYPAQTRGIASVYTDVTNQRSWSLRTSSSGTINALVSFDGMINTGVSNTTPVPLNEFSHIAFVRASDEIFIFVNGIKGSPVNIGASALFGSSASMKIASNISGGTNSFGGHIDELRVTKGVARYTSNFLPQCNEFGGA